MPKNYAQLELSTQIVIAEALKRGVKVEVLDEKDQFLRLSKGKHVEYVQEATRTSKDSYITGFILGNKLVTKKILDEHGVHVPKGKDYRDLKTAIQDYPKFSKGGWVVKPKTTNYGIGITIFKKAPSQKAFIQAVKIAFSHDSSILIEEFIEGIECRFLVIDYKTVAVLQRIPANVTGDGKHTIQQLVAIKNKDPRRGKGYKTPLEYIQISAVEKQILKDQKLTPQSIPKKGQQIFLRHNSNISTGGDSIDYTDKVTYQYKKIAEQAAKAVSAKICGVDMMLQNFAQPVNKNNYAIIELNYNPVLYFHDFPYEGKNRHTGKYLLDVLGF